MAELHPTSSWVHLSGLPLPRQALEQCSPGLLGTGLEARTASQPRAGATRPGRPLSPGSPGRAGGWVRAGGASLGAWQSDQGVFGLEAGGAARPRADAGQHGHLCAAGHPVAAPRWVLVFGAQAQDAL